MKKENYYKIMYAISLLLFLGFILNIVIDYIKYDPIITSAPFYVNIIIRLTEFLLPSIIFIIIGIIYKNKFSK